MRWLAGLFRCVLPLLFFGLVAGASAQGREGKRIQRVEILRLEEKWRAAQLAEDVPAMDKLLSDEFLGITASGQVVTKLQQLDRMRTRSLDIRQLDISDTKVKISGNVAVVTSLAQISGTADGEPLRGAFRYTRVYQRVAGDGWKITNFEATHVGRQAPNGVPRASSGGPGAAVSNSRSASPEGSGFPPLQS